MQETITLPLSPPTFWLIVLAGLIALGVSLAIATRPDTPPGPTDSPWQRFLTRNGLGQFPPAAALFAGAFWLILALTLAGGILTTIFTVPSAFSALTDDPDDTTLRWTLLTLTAMTGALGAVVAFPFTLIRIGQTKRQTDLQDEALFNDKINAAATDLAARRTVTRVIGRGAKTQVLSEEEDDLVTRAAAIDRLEGLALERADVAPRIARMLSIYVQELSRDPARAAKPTPAFEGRAQMQEWARALRPIQRTDMERAVQSLGRINPKDDDAREAFDPKNIDLRRCNLQGFDLRGLNFQGIQLGEAQMQGANLIEAKMQGAYLFGAKMQEANLFGAKMQGANLFGAEMQGADLREAKMQGADLREAKMQEAYLFGAEMQGANLFGAEMQGANLFGAEMDSSTDLTGASLWGVAVRSVDDTTLAQLRPHWDAIINFAETLPEDAPAHWVQTDDFDYNTFLTQWRAFAASLDPPVTIAHDYTP
ncbi:pentapeptide repeat-containing protein [Gymnodinialimonas sp. 57CJ19]|uniref:pentapeptide repeat-containing protein n=1 Tax=Gymnodinialimonas sp. 57CJ19 TaxID=3138498 RepID=UPI0031345EB2